MLLSIIERVIQHKETLLKAIFVCSVAGALLFSLNGCVISPRRIVDGTVTPTPTPGDTPTPTVTPTATPTPTPAAVASAIAGANADSSHIPEFLFIAAQSGSVQGFQIGTDGTLSAVAGSPFQIGDTPRSLLASGDSLVVAGSAALIVFQVDKVSGALRQTDSVSATSPQVTVDPASGMILSTANGETTTYRLVQGIMRTVGSAPARPQTQALLLPQSRVPGLNGQDSVIDATGAFAYTLNPKTNQIDAFRISSDKNLTPLNPPAYPAGNGAVSIALVAP